VNGSNWRNRELISIAGLKLRNKLLVGFAVPLVIIFIITVIVYSSVNKLLEADRWVDHTREVITEGKSLLSSMVDMEAGMRGFLVAGRGEVLGPYDAGQKSFGSTIRTLRSTVSDNPAQVRRLDDIDVLKDQWLADAAGPQIALRREVAEGAAASRRFRQLSERAVGKELFDGFRAELATVDRALRKQGKQKALYELQLVLTAMINKETGQRGFLLSGREASLQPYVEGKEAFDLHTKVLRRQLAGNGKLIVALDRAIVKTKGWVSQSAQLEIEARREMAQVTASLDDITALIEEGTGKRSMDTIRAKIGAFMEQQLVMV